MHQPQICNSKFEYMFFKNIVCFDSFQSTFNSSIKGFNMALSFFPGWFEPGMIKQRNINSYFIQREGGRLYEITKTNQHEYDDAIWPKGVKPSVASPIQTFLSSAAKSGSNMSRAFQASPSEGCTIRSSLSQTPSLCHRMWIAVFLDRNNRFTRGVSGK